MQGFTFLIFPVCSFPVHKSLKHEGYIRPTRKDGRLNLKQTINELKTKDELNTKDKQKTSDELKTIDERKTIDELLIKEK